jgi:hypothetical protein
VDIPQVCAHLLRQGESVRLHCKQLIGDLSQIHALREYGMDLEPDTKQMYDDRLAATARDIATLETVVEEVKSTVAHLTSPARTRPLPLVRW